MCIIVYSGNTIIEEVRALTKEQLEKIVSYWTEDGFKIRIVDSLN